MNTFTKLKDYNSLNEDIKSIQVFYNNEVASLITDKPDNIIVSLRDWFSKIDEMYNYHNDDNDLLFDIVNYLKKEGLLSGWKVYPHNIKKEVGFNIVINESDHIKVYYFENITPSEIWFD